MKNTTISKKDVALDLLKRMDIYAPYIKGFRESDKVCFFELSADIGRNRSPNCLLKCRKLKKSITASYMP